MVRKVCPECGSLAIHRYVGVRSWRSEDSDWGYKYRCKDCGHMFDNPDDRELDSDRIPSSGIARKLYEMDGDEI